MSERVWRNATERDRAGKVASVLERWGFPATNIPPPPPERPAPAPAGAQPLRESKPAPTATRKPAPSFLRTFDANPPYYPWEAADAELSEDLFSRVNPIDGRYPVQEETSVVATVRAPWSPGVQILQIKDPSWSPPGLAIYYLRRDDGSLYRLNGTSPAIHEVNASAGLKLSEENVLQYVRFFSFFVRGEEGPFYIYKFDRRSAHSGLRCDHSHGFGGHGTAGGVRAAARGWGVSSAARFSTIPTRSSSRKWSWHRPG